MPSQWDLPSYLQPDRNDPTQLVLASMQMGAQQAERKRQFALEVERFHLQQQQANAAMAHNSLLMQQQLDETEDAHALGPAMLEWNKGNFDAFPEGLRTIKGQLAAERLRASMKVNSAEGQVQNGWDNDYADIITGPEAEPLAKADLSRYPKYSPDWAERLGYWKEIVTGKRTFAKEQEFKAKQDILMGGRMTLEEERTRRALEVQKMRADTALENVQVRMKYQELIAKMKTPLHRQAFLRDMTKTIQSSSRTRVSVEDAMTQAEALWDKHVEENINAQPIAPATQTTTPTAAPVPDDPLGLFK